MSALFNQTNLAPGTSFAVGGGTIPSNPTFDSVTFTPIASGYSTISDTITGSFDSFTASNVVAITNSTDSNYFGPLIVGGYLESQDVGLPQNQSARMRFIPRGMTYIQPNAGTSLPIMRVSDTNASAGMFNISSITGNTQVININALASTLATAFPGCVG